MFFLGILSLLQIIFLPGSLLYKKIDYRGSFIQNLTFIFASSLIINYCGVFFLTALKLYTQSMVLFLFFVEIVLFFWLYRKMLNTPFESGVKWFLDWIESIIKAGEEFLKIKNKEERITMILSSVFFIGASVFALNGIWWAVKLVFYNTGTVFNVWDAIVSWNPWAIEWAQNSFPVHTVRYPQLIPTNWSLTYVFVDNLDVQFFAKTIVPLFTLFILLLLVDLGISTKKGGYLLGVFFTYLMIKKFLGGWVMAGYSDLPMAYFSLLSIYTLIKNNEKLDEESIRKKLFLGIFFASGAAVTKQPGLYLLAVFPLFAYFSLLRPIYGKDVKRIASLLWKPMVMAILIVLPWYFYKQITFIQGSDTTGIATILKVTQNAHKTTMLIELIKNAILQLDKYLALFILIALMIFFIDRLNRWVVLLIVFPFTLLWAGTASYDMRNLALVIPLLGMTAGVGFGKLIEMGIQLFVKIKFHRIKFWVILLFLLIAVFLGGFRWTSLILQEQQIELQRQLFSPDKNYMLLDYIEENPRVVNKILSLYPLEYIPGLREYNLNFNFNSLEEFKRRIDNPVVTHLMVPKTASEEIHSFIAGKIELGEYELIFNNAQWKKYQFIRIR